MTTSVANLAGFQQLSAILENSDKAPDPGALSRWIERAPAPEEALAGLARLGETAGAGALAAALAEAGEDFVFLCGASRALVRYLGQQGDALGAAVLAFRNPAPDAETLAARLDPGDCPDQAALARALRRGAAAEIYRIGARDLLGLATPTETLESLTLLAEVGLRVATIHLRRLLAAEHGDPTTEDGRPVEFVVLGLGKLGGRELNFSSDIDVVYLYETDRVAEGSTAPLAFFTRLGSAITRTLGENTADGHVFRVDLRLRPEGLNGPPVNTVGNALRYYEGWGDTWERGALAKARPVSGDLALGERFIAELRPFIYRRHLDFHTVEDLRAMKDRIDAELAMQRPGKRNVKIGRGGIRELEFVVQMLQLIHGGHDASVSTTGTMRGLVALEDAGYIARSEGDRLREAYRFLRDTEHAIQIDEKRQTQQLPTDRGALRRLARVLGYGTGRRGRPVEGDELERFEADWLAHTEFVHDTFVRFLELRPEEDARKPPSDPVALALLSHLGEGRREEAVAILSELGFRNGEAAADGLARIYTGGVRAPASPQRRRAMEALTPALLDAVLRSSDPETALGRLVDFLLRTGAHTSYLALFSGSPKTMRILVTLFASSPYLASLLVGHPELVDSLVRSDALGARRDPEALRAELRVSLAAEMPEDRRDEEAVLAALRRFRRVELLRAGMGDLSGELSVPEVGVYLTAVADVCLEAAVGAAREIVRARVDGPWDKLRLAVIAMGKMGAAEMSYGSDLDLIFVYGTDRDDYDPAAHAPATKWVQKTISLLTSSTRDGRCYEVDTRLRPSGTQGPLVTSIERFIAYHRAEAELWERQALIRARVVVGEEGLSAKVDRAVEEFVYGRSLDDEGVAEIRALRMRVENELAGESSERVNFKTGRGGIVDIEFLVQMLQLRHGLEHPPVRVRGTLPALEALGAEGLLAREAAAGLADHYAALRRLEARLRLERDRPVEELGTDAAALDPLARRLGFSGEEPGAILLEDYARRREEVRACYDALMGAATR